MYRILVDFYLFFCICPPSPQSRPPSTVGGAEVIKAKLTFNASQILFQYINTQAYIYRRCKYFHTSWKHEIAFAKIGWMSGVFPFVQIFILHQDPASFTIVVKIFPNIAWFGKTVRSPRKIYPNLPIFGVDLFVRSVTRTYKTKGTKHEIKSMLQYNFVWKSNYK